MSKGKCIIFSAPSGSGKTTLVKHLLDQNDLNLAFSISATTRKKREGETEGVDYLFKTILEFQNLITNKELLEFEEVYENVFYGTLKREAEELLKTRNVIFDIDVHGGLKLKQYFKSKAISVFVKPPSVDELQRRLISRNKDTIESIQTRVLKAHKEISKGTDFDKIIVNDNLDTARLKAFNVVKKFILQ
ncbi:MAG: guanylate kinase [Bacteroidetes bacterium]|jgi:guanylate kinase|nr:MAG: guanylate kinase [Cryomorphaceae bacterium BACL29 MAG-121220-bin8]MDA0758020.1 guanylate kinase [Bacteroidota bacterium]|tara:strand:+ start:41390 stop:41959 length:570 start_codon:yes stop_codon:yes gene_type:complete